MTEQEKQNAFENARKKIIGMNRQRFGIGTLSEKTVHAVLKNYFAPDEDNQEIPINEYVADIYKGGEIFEIQTRQFYKMREKLKTFLPQYPVTICYPIAKEKNLIWIDPETGDLSDKRKSPMKQSVYSVFPELYAIKDFLKDPNLRFRLVLMAMDEYKIADGWGKKNHKNPTKFDRVPTALIEEVEINCPEDYMQFVPIDLPEEFTVKDFSKSAHIKSDLAKVVLNILFFVGTVERTGKIKNAYLYKVNEKI